MKGLVRHTRQHQQKPLSFFPAVKIGGQLRFRGVTDWGKCGCLKKILCTTLRAVAFVGWDSPKT